MHAATIEIINFKQNEKVKHEIVFIKGRICPILEQLKHEKLSLQQVQPIEPQVNYLITNLAHNGIFKVLLDLRNFQDTTNFNFLLNCGPKLQKTLTFSFEPTTLQHYYKIQPLLIQCVDEQLVDSISQQQKCIIDLNLRLVQSIYADRLPSINVQRCTFVLNGNCTTFKSKLTCAALWQLSAAELWQHIAGELLNSVEWRDTVDYLKFIGFISCTKYNGAAVAASGDYSYANIQRHLQGHVAMGSGGLALFSVAYFYAWPQQFSQIIVAFNNEQKVDLGTQPDESNFRRSYAGVYASTLGAICHELGHIFDLGHTKQGIMGTGFDYVNRLLTVDKATELLPARLVDKSNFLALLQPRARFTQLKTNHVNNFLDKYREQQLNDQDDFYFSTNCVIMLMHHKWFAYSKQKQKSSKILHEHIQLQYNNKQDNNDILVLVNFPYVLKLIEVRTNDNSLVVWFNEFCDSDNTIDNNRHSYKLPINMINYELQQTHLIVLTACGEIKRLEFLQFKQK